MACTIYFDLSHKYFIQFTYILRSIIICEKKIQIQPCLMLLRWVYIFFPKHTFAYNSIPFVIIVRVIFYMKSALAFLVIFAIPFKRLGNTSKYHAANKYSSSHPNILMYQYHYIWYWYRVTLIAISLIYLYSICQIEISMIKSFAKYYDNLFVFLSIRFNVSLSTNLEKLC